MPDVRNIKAKDRFEKDKNIIWIIGAIIAAVLLIIHVIKMNNFFDAWKPIIAVFFPISICYMIMDIFLVIALKFTKEDISLSRFRIAGIIVGITAAMAVALVHGGKQFLFQSKVIFALLNIRAIFFKYFVIQRKK